MVCDDNTLLWRVVLHSLANEFLHSISNDVVPIINYAVGDLDLCLYTDNVGDARDDSINDDA